MARKRSVRTEALNRTLSMLRIPLGEPERLPVVMQQILRQIAVPDVVIAFAFQPITGNLVNVSTSALPNEPEAYSQVANAASRVAQIFQAKAMEVLRNAVPVGKPEEVGQDAAAFGSVEQRDGVDEVDTEASPDNDSGELPSS